MSANQALTLAFNYTQLALNYNGTQQWYCIRHAIALTKISVSAAVQKPQVLQAKHGNNTMNWNWPKE